MNYERIFLFKKPILIKEIQGEDDCLLAIFNNSKRN